MKIDFNTRNLQRSLKILSKIGNDDVLVDGYKSELIKQDSNTTIKIDISGVVKEGGRSIIPAAVIPLIQKLKFWETDVFDDEVQSGNKVIKFRSEELAYKSNEEPRTPKFSITQKELHELLEIKYAIAQDDIRPVLTGVYFGNGETAALDGFRLAVRKGSFQSDTAFIINKDSIKVLNAIISPDSNKRVDVYYDNYSIMFEIIGDGIKVICKCIEGDFIKYKSIIPEEFTYTAVINSDKLVNELNFVDNKGIIKLHFCEDKLTLIQQQCKEVYDDEASRVLTQELQEEKHKEYIEKYNIWVAKKAKAEKNKKAFKQKCPNEKHVRMQKVLKNVSAAEVKSEIDCEFNYRDEFKIAFNAKYFSEAVKQYSGNINLWMTSNVSPIVIKNDTKTELVLPVRILENI